MKYAVLMTSLESYLATRRKLVETAIETVIPNEDAEPGGLHAAMRYAVFSGGKRLRPIICLAACEAAGGEKEQALKAAAAIELLHAYTLVHDDLPSMDDDKTRRGMPTCHIKFGTANAILAGDALQALAFGSLAEAEARAPYTSTNLVSELAYASGSLGVVGGQYEDLAARGSDPGHEKIEFIHQHKTADLFRASARIGAMAAGASLESLDALTSYGNHLGLAFQLADDILDGENREDVEKVKERVAILIGKAKAALEAFDAGGRRPLEEIATLVAGRADAI